MNARNPNASSNDISLSNNPFIWGHMALLAGVPWLLSLSMAGLAVGDPVFPAWFEIILLGFPAIALVTWVQWQKPLSPFSFWVVAKPTENLSDRDRRILTLIKQYSNGWYVTGWIAIAVSVLSSVVFYKIYISAPLAQAIAPFPNWLRFFGILWAEFFFVLSNVLLQAGFSALRVQLTPESELLSLQPFAIAKIKNSFTNIAWRSPQLLKFFEDEQIVPDKLINAENAKSKVAEEKENVSPLTSNEIAEKAEVEASLDEKILGEEPEKLDANQFVIDSVVEVCEIDVILDITETISVSQIVEIEKFDIEAIAETINLDLEIDNLIQQEPEVLDNSSNDYELDELIAFNIYVENILQNYLEEPFEEVNEVETIVEIAATSELVAEIVETVLASEATLAESIDPQPIFASEPEIVAEANIPMNVETIADNLLAIKTEVTEEIPESLTEGEAENEQKEPEYNEPEYNEQDNEQELLVDEFLARIEALNVADRANKESLDQVKEPVAEVDVFADLEALLDDKPLPENLE